ncbi:sugar transporter [Pusillimonas sp. TS35]|uniref:polysaccharide biosynthesis/export family protein n=1 Tax=Paracandidimonas lactea TaxID=2895524 RepID=UPI0013683D80|nr:polysaccharide biosynthesis/export family protein [Paracandidimonas lactea]MYN13587.1 sugar transporter [Pusillimonas sp. TS35]
MNTTHPAFRRLHLAKRTAASLSLAALPLFLAACSISPGVYMGDPKKVEQELNEPGAPPGALIPISTDLLAREANAARTNVAPDVEQLFTPPERYLVGPGDILNIVVWNHPELALSGAGTASTTAVPGAPDVGNGYNVSPDGMIQFPFLGPVRVSGMNEYQIRAMLVRRLVGHISEPQITVRIQAYRNGRVYVDGEVRTPGLQTINDVPMTLPEAISRAGGFTEEADRSSVVLTRDGKRTVINLMRLADAGVNPSRIMLRNGDLLQVINQQENKVFVLGDVYVPRAQPMHDGRLTLAQALGEAGGVNPLSGNPRQVYVIRKGEDGNAQIYHLDASKPTAMVLASDFQLRGRDMVFVDPAPVVRWQRVISNILPSYGAVAATRDMTR